VCLTVGNLQNGLVDINVVEIFNKNIRGLNEYGDNVTNFLI